MIYPFTIILVPKSGYGATGQQRLSLSANMPVCAICRYHLPFIQQNSLKGETVKYESPFIAIVFVLTDISISSIELLNIVKLFQPAQVLGVNLELKLYFVITEVSFKNLHLYMLKV